MEPLLELNSVSYLREQDLKTCDHQGHLCGVQVYWGGDDRYLQHMLVELRNPRVRGDSLNFVLPIGDALLPSIDSLLADFCCHFK